MTRTTSLSTRAIALAASFALAFSPILADANPQGGVVSTGQANIVSSGNQLDINQSSSKAIIDWRSFNIAPNEATVFNQPSSSSITLNRVNDMNPSAIEGRLSANGTVVIVNPNGVFFGPGSKVDVSGLIATTADIANNDFMAGNMNFSRPGNPNASVVNQGTITASDAGLVGLVAPNVENDGVINARLGKVTLASGDTFTLDLAGDQLISVAVSADQLPQQAVVNTGTIAADGGTVTLTAAAARNMIDGLIGNSGTIRSHSIGKVNGRIILYAEGENAVVDNVAVNKGQKAGSSTVTNSGVLDASGYGSGETGGSISVLGDNVSILSGSRLDASGDAGGGTIQIGGDFHGAGTTPTAVTARVDSGSQIFANAINSGDGGNVAVWSDDYTNFAGAIEAKGGVLSGNGGFVETSGHQLLDFSGTVNTLAPSGVTGTLLLDPENVTIANGSSVTDSCSSGTCTPTGDSSVLNVSTLNTALGGSNVTVTTGGSGVQTGNIVVSGTADTGGAVAINWGTSNLLLLSAAGGITIDAGATITNTYNTSTAASTLPVFLALRADNLSAVNGSYVSTNSYGVTNNGTINFSGSTGAVSIFNDIGFTAVNGTQTANGSWATPNNQSVSSQFTTYKLINGVGDITGTLNSNLGGTYALGQNITSGGTNFNSNTSLGQFNGILDGQYGMLASGASLTNGTLAGNVYGITGITMTLADSGANQYDGFFSKIIGGAVRNLKIGNTISETYTGTGSAYVGALAGTTTNAPVIANVSTTSSDTVTGTNSLSNNASNNTMYVGGLLGFNAGTAIIVGSNAAGNVYYYITGNTNSTTSNAFVGGLIGRNNSTAAYDGSTTFGSVYNSSASGNVYAQYSGAGAGNASIEIGGLFGAEGGGGATASYNNYATGNVTSNLVGGNEQIGGLSGYMNDTSSYAIVNSYSTTGTPSYTGTGTGSSAISIGGLVGNIFAGTVTGTDATYKTYSSEAVSYSGAAAPTIWYIGGLVGYNAGTITYAKATGNVSYTGSTINTADVGGLVGYNVNIISNSTTATTDAYATTGVVTATANLSGSNASTINVGGLVGQNGINTASGTISGSSSSENVVYDYTNTTWSSGSSNAHAGGLVGYNNSTAAYDGSNTFGSVYNSNASGTVTAQYTGGSSGQVNTNIGGLIGFNGNNTATATYNNYATGSVTSNLAGAVQYIGGLVGLSYSTSANAITNSYSTTGAPTYTGAATTSSISLGGLVGYNQSGTITGTSNSYLTYSSEAVTYNGTATPSAFYLGGLVGLNVGTVTYAKATGSTSITDGTAGGSVGGLVGYNNGGTVSNSTSSSGTVTGTANRPLKKSSQLDGRVTLSEASLEGCIEGVRGVAGKA